MTLHPHRNHFSRNPGYLSPHPGHVATRNNPSIIRGNCCGFLCHELFICRKCVCYGFCFYGRSQNVFIKRNIFVTQIKFQIARYSRKAVGRMRSEGPSCQCHGECRCGDLLNVNRAGFVSSRFNNF